MLIKPILTPVPTDLQNKTFWDNLLASGEDLAISAVDSGANVTASVGQNQAAAAANNQAIADYNANAANIAAQNIAVEEEARKRQAELTKYAIIGSIVFILVAIMIIGRK